MKLLVLLLGFLLVTPITACTVIRDPGYEYDDRGLVSFYSLDMKLRGTHEIPAIGIGDNCLVIPEYLTTDGTSLYVEEGDDDQDHSAGYDHLIIDPLSENGFQIADRRDWIETDQRLLGVVGDQLVVVSQELNTTISYLSGDTVTQVLNSSSTIFSYTRLLDSFYFIHDPVPSLEVIYRNGSMRSYLLPATDLEILPSQEGTHVLLFDEVSNYLMDLKSGDTEAVELDYHLPRHWSPQMVLSNMTLYHLSEGMLLVTDLNTKETTRYSISGVPLLYEDTLVLISGTTERTGLGPWRGILIITAIASVLLGLAWNRGRRRTLK